MMDESINNPGLGKRLQQAREALHLSVKEAATRLHLNANVIQILEAEQFKNSLPPTFVRGYLRSYGRLLNIPDHEINTALEQLNITTKPTALDVGTMLTTVDTQKDRRFVQWTTYSIISVLIVLVGFWWSSHPRNATPDKLASEETAVEPAKPAIVPAATSPISIPTSAPASTTTATAQPITTAKPPLVSATPAPVATAPAATQQPPAEQAQAPATIAAQATPPASASTPPTAQPSQPPLAAGNNATAPAGTTPAAPVPQPSAAPLAGQLNPLQQQPVVATTTPPTTPAPEHTHKRSHRSEMEMMVPEPGISD